MNSKIKVYFEHSVWNRLIEDTLSDAKKAKQKKEIERIIRFRDDTNKILIFASEAVKAESMPLREKSQYKFEEIQNIIKSKTNDILKTEYNRLDSNKFGIWGLARFPTKEFMDAHTLFISKGFGKDDSVHLATALTKEMDIFLTVDEKTIIRRRVRVSNLSFKIMLPSEFIKEYKLI